MGSYSGVEGAGRGVIRRRPVVIANEIRLKRSQHRGAFLLVEGRDDRLFCERFVDSSGCKIVVGEGKESICDVLAILDEYHFTGALGLVDSDFDRIEGRVHGSPNLLSPDLHDLECMLLRSKALDMLIIELGSREKLQRFGRDVRDTLLMAAFPIGCLRLHSKQAGLNLKFDGLNYACCIDQNSLSVDPAALVEEVKNRSQRQDIPLDALTDAISMIEAEGHDPWELCSGADLLGIFSVGLRRALGTNSTTDVSHDQLRRELRLAYSEQEFAASGLKQSLRDWENGNPPFRILRS